MFKKIALLVSLAVIVIAGAFVASPAASATNAPSCIDASKTKNLVYTWSGYDKVEISTQDGKAPCEDVDMYFSAYVMPDTWDKTGFNDTAVPQTLHRSVNVKLKAGKAHQKVTAHVQLPSDCKNVQVDLYFAPEQKRITMTDKIGTRLITAKYRIGSGECVVTPEKPVVEKPVVETPLPAELPETGSSLASVVVAGLVATSAYAIVLRLRK